LRSPRPPFLPLADAVVIASEVVEQPFKSFENLPLTAFVTTRRGGVSDPPFDTLNLAYLTADRRDCVRTNRERVAGALGLDHDRLLIGRQVHGAIVNPAEDIEIGTTPGDGILLTRPGSAAMVVVADCVPLLLYDPAVHAGVVVHAGWRGLAAGVIGRAVGVMLEQGVKAPDIVAGIGPAIGRCCYEVGPEVVAALRPEDDEFAEGEGDRSMLDLKAVTRRQLGELGVKGQQIEDLEICTRCQNERYFSARAGEPTGRFAAGLKLLQANL
jgi:YfiH family protein